MIKNFLFVVAAAACINGALAQKIVSPVPYAKTITPAGLKKHLSIIAGAEMEGRGTPSPGLEKAAQYIESQFRAFGVKPGNNGSYRQYYDLEKDSTETPFLNVGGTDFVAWQDFAPYFQMPNAVQFQFSEYVFVGYGIVDDSRDDYKGADVNGKLVVFFNGQPNGYVTPKPRGESPVFVVNKIANAKKKGAAAVLIVTEQLPTKQKTNSTYRPKQSATPEEATNSIPVFYINDNVVSKKGHTIKELKAAVEAAPSTPVATPGRGRNGLHFGKKIATASNVIGVVEGTDKKNEYLFVTAHYDHLGKDVNGNIYYGADDDGSGTVSVMKMAQAFAKAKKEGKGPRRTIVFMLVSGEEKGLWGSEYYSENPIYPLQKTTADLNIDMIGRVDTERTSADTLNYVYVVGHDKLSTDLPKINEGVNNKYTRLVLDYKFDDPKDPNDIYYRSDHFNFARKGVPVLFFYDGMLGADYHRLTDTVDKINFALMAKRAQMIFYTAWEMANRQEMLKRDLQLPE